jgi:hypothetical protein
MTHLWAQPDISVIYDSSLSTTYYFSCLRLSSLSTTWYFYHLWLSSMNTTWAYWYLTLAANYVFDALPLVCRYGLVCCLSRTDPLCVWLVGTLQWTGLRLWGCCLSELCIKVRGRANIYNFSWAVEPKAPDTTTCKILDMEECCHTSSVFTYFSLMLQCNVTWNLDWKLDL